MNHIQGISAFGLKDCVATMDKGCTTNDFYLADAVLPQSALGHIRIGDDAEEERIHSGLRWPPEARVTPEAPLRRVPIPVAWSLLVDAGDRPVRWNAGKGVSIPLATILTAHIKGLVAPNNASSPLSEEIVVAIPDHLDEFGQEALLQAFGRSRNQVQLLWRPVAAAMAWLDLARPADLTDDDFMLVIYMGPDGMEFTTFGLKEEVCKGQRFVLPVRNRPLHGPLPAGWEWACALSAKADSICQEDYGAFWQTFTNFPELWETIAGIDWDVHHLPQPWSTAEGWRSWNPDQSLQEQVYDCALGQSEILLKLLRKSCSIPLTNRKGHGRTWNELLGKELKTALLRQKGKLRGAVLCGPLAPPQIPHWLNQELTLPPGPTPKPDKLWIPSTCNDPVAVGASLFGERLAAHLPTYLDTLPGLALLTQKQGDLEWVDIVKSSECPGGRPYTDSIGNRFFLPENSSSMNIHFKKEIRLDNEKKPKKPVSKFRNEFIRPIEDKVRGLGSVDAVFAHKAWDLHPELRDYARNYAKCLYWKPDLSKSPFRQGSVEFPAAPVKNVHLTVNVEMRPASGLARVQFVPEKEAALMGRPVTFDYSRMAPIAEGDLPEPQLRWPELLHIETTTDTGAFNDTHITNFLQLPDTVNDATFIDNLDAMKVAVCTGVLAPHSGVFLKKIDEKGETNVLQGNAIISKIAARIERQSKRFLEKNRTWVSQNTRIFLIRSSWLWAATPQRVIGYIEHYFLNHEQNRYDRTWNYLVESSSRCFTTDSQFKIIFQQVYNRSVQDQGNPFPLPVMRSLARILTYRETAWQALNNAMVTHFANRTAQIICAEIQQNKVEQIFFQGALFILGLLRVRMAEPSFLDPDEPSDTFKRIEHCLSEGMEIARTQGKPTKTVNLIEQIVNFMYSKGCKGIISQVAAQAGE
ncbi:hypothetical protein [Desulfovibrio sp. Huiquan2017]|uniref:hypothetical protein n=1 Tax=Desulfovibrio sp. Huiquan2017 TaxID=2816861 RepID=UPI001A936C09|nr:hypothetical protein [Desulfovibrio sp. Huiquan2017]